MKTGFRKGFMLSALAGTTLAAATMFGAAPAQADAIRDGRGTGPGFSVILCKPSDQAAEPNAPSWFADLLINRGRGGVGDYFYDQSRGRYDISKTSVVKGWYTTSKTQAQIKAMTGDNSRWDKINLCIQAAQATGYTVPAGNRVVAVYNVGVNDGGRAGSGVLMQNVDYNTGFAAHEMLHTLGASHSWSNDTSYQNAPWSGLGEYDDPWDEMSAMNIFSSKMGHLSGFTPGAVGLNGFQRDKLGWLPRNKIAMFGADGRMSGNIIFSQLDNPSSTAPLLVRVPIKAADPTHYYTLEYRKKAGWDGGIPADIMLIHEIKGNKSYLIRTLGTTDRAPVQSLDANGVKISVAWTSGDLMAAYVSISQTAGVYGPNTCINGYTWREADQHDYVCVTPATRNQARSDNAADATRHIPGSTWCISGFVWRDAFAGDIVCVVPSVRTQAGDDNSQYWGRIAQH